ncbi:TetR/AcrR family transcriptional regulator [Microbacterium rhizomatis]|uniref:TetR/AcrR family transcriptional regulator n=1 Tax=Microbacterium rhizomatis TaxID=1631477 RepID=A0A5J5J3K9_9MICO|nr:TetR/AcrR family transcriptional regulator [Microbacterium rhizomatis]KAA9110636.1 TetR/AcrR family transcriptional regulator [Microbacterium rhizomatis]
MSRPPRARESVLDAFEALLVEDGERAATMDAAARRAGVSKGGLLYHFGSKEALVEGLIERLRVLSLEDIEQIRSAPDGPVAAFMRTSIMTGTALDRTIIALSRLAQNGHPAASDALRDLRLLWEDAMRSEAKDETALQLIMLVSDGLYFNNALTVGGVPGPVPTGADLDALIALVRDATSR